jgi:hypothetical protein
MSFNQPLLVKINLKNERVRIRRIKIIIRNPTRPRHNLLMIRINTNLDILALFVVKITTQKIFQDVPRSQSSFKGPKNLLYVPFCFNPSLLNNMPNWSFMINLLLPLLRMSLCVPVILRRMMLHLLLEPNITLLLRRKLMMSHLCWFSHLLQIHLPTVLFISNDRAPIQFSAPPPPPKGIVRKSAFNPHARASQKYSIVEGLAQAPSTMSALEVLQSCPSQRKALLKDIGGIDPIDTNLIIFDLEDHIPRLPSQLAFQIQVVVENKNICRTIIDEGASTCVMSITCWKAIVSPLERIKQHT